MATLAGPAIESPSDSPNRRAPASEHQSHEDPRPAVTAGARLDDPHEPHLLEHRGDADIPERDVDAAAFGVDGIGLDARRAGAAGIVDDAVEQCRGDATPAEPDTDLETQDRPDRLVVDLW